jgi:hypothetical protein
LEEYMEDESNTPQEEVEGHVKRAGPEDAERHIGRQEDDDSEVEGHARMARQEDDDDDEVEAHIKPRMGPEEPGRHF